MRTEKEIKEEIKKLQQLLLRCKSQKAKDMNRGRLQALAWCVYYTGGVDEQ